LFLRPLLWCAAAFAAGLTPGWPDLGLRCYQVLAGAALAGALLLSWLATSRSSLRFATMLVMSGFCCAGGLARLASERVEPDQILSLLRQHPSQLGEGVDVSGRLVSWSLARNGRKGEADALLLTLDLDRLRLGRVRLPARGRIRLRAPAAAALTSGDGRLVRGASVEAFARLQLPRRYANPGSFDYPLYLKVRGIQGVGSVKSSRLLKIGAPDRASLATLLMRKIDHLRLLILGQLRDAFPQSPAGDRARDVAAALLLGERVGIRAEDLAALQEAGLSHLLAVSGFNVAVLAALVFFTLRCARMPSRGAALAAIPALGFYLALNREESSVARAVVMAVAYLAGRLIWRRPDLLNTLGLSALCILIPSPLQLHDAGFQLTFAATFSLILLTPGIARAMRVAGGKGRLAGWSRGILAVSLAALVGTLPLAVMHFHRVTPGALPANVVGGPLMAAAFVMVIALEIVQPFSATAGAALARAVAWAVEGTFLWADLIRSTPAMSYPRAYPGMLACPLYYAGLLVWAALGPGRPRRRLLALGTAVGSAIWLAIPFDTRPAPGGLRLTMLDVGQGDATLVETPAGERILVDAGGVSRGEFDVGERVVSPAMWHLGISSLDFLVVTHEDVDHAGGAAAIVKNFSPREVWLPVRLGPRSDRGGVGRLLAALRRMEIPVREMSRGDRVELRGAEIEVLHPPRSSHGTVKDKDNELSLVLRIRSGGRGALLAADIGTRSEADIGALDVRSDFLKVSHHGSRSATSPPFLEKVRPRVAGISSGPNNRFGHPDPVLLDRLGRAGARVCRTDLCGGFDVTLGPGPGGGTRLSPSCALASGR